MQHPVAHNVAKIARIEPDRPEFVQVVCPYPVLAAGLARALGEARVRHGPRPPDGDVAHCVLLWAESAEGLSEAVGSLQEANPDAPVLVFGLRDDLSLARDALRAGARGFVHAGMRPAQIARALSVALKGEVVAPRGLIEFLLADGDSPVDLDLLSARQREILEFVVEGLTNGQIAKSLFLSESTVKQHLRAAYKLLGVKNRTEAAKLMRRSG